MDRFLPNTLLLLWLSCSLFSPTLMPQWCVHNFSLRKTNIIRFLDLAAKWGRNFQMHVCWEYWERKTKKKKQPQQSFDGHKWQCWQKYPESRKPVSQRLSCCRVKLLKRARSLWSQRPQIWLMAVSCSLYPLTDGHTLTCCSSSQPGAQASGQVTRW